jgi:hypothetical protein
MGKKKTNI